MDKGYRYRLLGLLQESLDVLDEWRPEYSDGAWAPPLATVQDLRRRLKEVLEDRA